MRTTSPLSFLRGTALGVVALSAFAAPASAAPPVPSGAHPRLFMSAKNLAGFKSNAKKEGTAAAGMVRRCQETIDNPEWTLERGGVDGDVWPGSALACAFAYRATDDADFLDQAIKFWRAAMEDDQTLGDGLGCVVGADPDWRSFPEGERAPIIVTVTHDTGYPIRWYGPDIALVYDWLFDAPGVDEILKVQTRTCLTAWNDYYTEEGYHHDEVGANYNAGYVASITLGSIAIGNDGGEDGHLWETAVDTVMKGLIVGKGLEGNQGGVGDPAGVLVGGDWAEGWQYGPLSVAEYAGSARAIEEAGAPLPEMDAWVNSLILRYVYATVPRMNGFHPGNGDFDSEEVYATPNANALDAILLGPSSDDAAAFAMFMKKEQGVTGGDFIWNVLGELRDVAPVDFTKQKPAPSLWYLARGTRSVFARTSWDADAFWSVFTSSPQMVSDHQHFGASNFVFMRGGDALVVDSSGYGGFGTLANNAVSVDSPGCPGDYALTQTPWSLAELPWARGTTDAVYAARSDFARAFDFNGTPSDIPYAHREWAMLPEGEIVTIDRAKTQDAAHPMSVRFHTNTKGSLAIDGDVAKGKVGDSDLAIHTVSLSGGAPDIRQPEVGECSVSCSYPCGACDAARFPVDEYVVEVPGPWAVAVHVIDGLATGEDPAVVMPLDDPAIDPAPKKNAGVLGAAVFRGDKQSYVVASSAEQGKSGATMTYGVPGESAGRHIVFDAPETADGESEVTVANDGERCVITVRAGKGFAGRPLMFTVSTADDGCEATEATNVEPGKPPGGGGLPGTGSGGSGSGGDADAAGEDGGCGCGIAETGSSRPLAALALVAFALLRAKRPRRARR